MAASFWCTFEMMKARKSWSVATAHREAAGRTRRLGDGRRRGDDDGLREEDGGVGKRPSSSWRLLLREVDEDEEETTAVLFCYSGELEDGHGDGGRRQRQRCPSSCSQ
jgi:hypothetical protein